MKLKALWWYLFNKKKYRNYIILRWIEYAKKEYIKYQYLGIGLCASLIRTMPDIYISRGYSITDIIPEYRPEFFKKQGIEINYRNCYWWPKDDKKSRLKAMDKLIQVYKDKLKN